MADKFTFHMGPIKATIVWTADGAIKGETPFQTRFVEMEHTKFASGKYFFSIQEEQRAFVGHMNGEWLTTPPKIPELESVEGRIY